MKFKGCKAPDAWCNTRIISFFFYFVPFFVLCCCSASFADELRDVRGPVALQSDWWWVLIILGILAVVGIVWGIILFLGFRKKPLLSPPLRPVWEIAYEKLDRLERSHLISEGRIKEYYEILSDIVRYYIEGRFSIRAPEMTTEEFMDKARCSTSLSDAQKVFLRDFLDASDMVKFAKFVPSFDQMKDTLRFARRFVDETKAEVCLNNGI
ncbi:MAG: hypothetical protein HQL21_06450 [Candidatus Omnitrophica bacterium]|nr:hypothetical protein [Candidatus Omnitrophota bacterium]